MSGCGMQGWDLTEQTDADLILSVLQQDRHRVQLAESQIMIIHEVNVCLHACSSSN